jgi:DNA/RNA endonuclease YhcR with UshA esterase domain
MKKIIAVAVTCFISVTALCQRAIAVDSASTHVGDSVMVCSKVYGVKSLEKITFINLGAAYPNSPLTIVIRAEDRGNFPQPAETMYENKNVCVTGTIKEYKGRYEIDVTTPAEIAIEPSKQ